MFVFRNELREVLIRNVGPMRIEGRVIMAVCWKNGSDRRDHQALDFFLRSAAALLPPHDISLTQSIVALHYGDKTIRKGYIMLP